MSGTGSPRLVPQLAHLGTKMYVLVSTLILNTDITFCSFILIQDFPHVMG